MKKTFFLLFLLAVACVVFAQEPKTSNAPFLKPAEAVAKMSIPEGFDVSIFAAEPDIAEPIAFCFDDLGRMWVAENLNYRTRRQHTNDQVSRIQILEDTDGDGVFDKKKMFTDKLTFIDQLDYKPERDAPKPEEHDVGPVATEEEINDAANDGGFACSYFWAGVDGTTQGR